MGLRPLGGGGVVARSATIDPLRFDSTRLRTWKAGLGRLATTPVDILAVGDSVTEGYGASTQANRWVELLRDKLRATYQPAGVTGGEGYVAAHFVSAPMTDRFVGAGAAKREDLGGLGERCILITSGTVTFNFTGTGLDILYSRGSTAGTFSWAIDGGAATNVNANNATINGGSVVQVRGLSAGAHTLTLAWISGGNGAYIEGCMVYNGDESRGIRMWEAGHSGWQADDLATEAAIPWTDSITPVQPDLVTIMLGLNDYASGSQTRFTAADFKTNLQSLIAKIKAKCTVQPSIVLIIPYERGTSGTLLSTWAEYRAVYDQVADADTKIALVDLGPVIGSFAGNVDPNNLDYNGDFLHPNDTGHALIAEAVYQALITF